MPPPRDRIVVTGGPGSGKSTLIDLLARAGFGCSEEAGRGVIQHQVAVGGRGLPWVDPALFAELMLCWELRSFHVARPESAAVFFDRGLCDIIGYLRLEDLPVPAHVHAAARDFRYHARVFSAPPWPEIYRTDSERKQSPDLARRTYESMVTTYTEYSYELVELPKCPPEQRMRFVLDTLGG